MKPGIYYLYEYKNKQKLRNVGFFKITQHYHSCILKINLRKIPVQGHDTVYLFAFFDQDSNIVSKQISEISCDDGNISANLTVSDSMLPDNRSLEAIDGFFVRTDNDQIYCAAANESNFDTRKIKIWENPPVSLEIRDESNQEKAVEIPQEIETETVLEVASREDTVDEPDEETNFDLETEIGEDLPPGLPNNPARDTSPVFPDNPHRNTSSVLPKNPPRMSSPEHNQHLHTETDENADETVKSQSKSLKKVRKIQRSDLSTLPRRYWNIANNSFLMHGYHNYNHLMLVEENGHYWIGVPGIYTTREARAAELFGFPQFTQSHVEQLELEKEEKDDAENFGYWCRYMK